MVARARDESKLATAPAPAERDALAELAAMRADLVNGAISLIDSYVRDMQKTPDEALAAHRAPSRADLAQTAPQQVEWRDLERLLETDAAAATAVWARIRDAARQELESGMRTARAIERPYGESTPYERAQFSAILNSLREAMQPRDGLEDLLVQQMAEASALHLRWQRIAVTKLEQDAWEGETAKRAALRYMGQAERESYENTPGWLPPRLTTAQAIEQAVLMADRYQRAFLRLLKQFRDTRKLIGMVVVGSGGTLNVADKQVNVQSQ